MSVDSRLLGSLEWRTIGPFRGGRVPAVVGHPTEQATFFFGACGGGVWKTTDAGVYWENISDGYFTTSSIGAIAIADSDPNVIYVGTGETSIRGDVIHGDGVYKSTDGGQTWAHVGLRDSQAISTVRIHPQNADIVYVAVLGHVWGSNDERGVYRTTDGGKTWEQVLFRSPGAGAIDLTIDPGNPRHLVAALWDAQRYPYQLRSGGPDSSIYQSFDGGDTWTDITRNAGLPTGTLGKIGVAISPASPNRIWALIEAEDGALFRSDDRGATWQRVSDNGDLRRRAWYYTHIFADPSDADTVWVLNLKCWKSIDGGRTFTAVPTPHGDNQDLWIDPTNSERMIEGNDGGANVSLNGGRTWSSIYNQPTGQFYHVTTDNRTPFNVYGSQQDNTALGGASSSARGAITLNDWFQPGGGESGYIAIKPTDENIIFGGAIGSGAGNGRLLKYNHETKASSIHTVWPEVTGMGRGAEALKYRFQWTFPISFSPHDPDTLYVTSNVVHRSTDDGMSWEVISPDLSHNDPATLGPSGGPISRDNTGAEAYGTVFAFVESPHERGFFWAGTDDGRLHTSEGGNDWTDVSIPSLPERAMISIIEVSPHDAATAYVAATRYKHDDFTPYLYKTTDYGQTWTLITNGIPENDFTRVIREDPNRKGLLYAGTETGVYVSFDDGAHWQRLNGDESVAGRGRSLPLTPVYDLIVKGTDLIVATHGRAFWILDDLTVLHQLADEVSGSALTLLAPRTVERFTREGRPGDYTAGYKAYGRFGGMMATSIQKTRENGELEVRFLDAGSNPPYGAVIHYWLQTAPEGAVTVTFKDADGNEVRSFTSSGSGQRPTAKAGMNRFVWNLRRPSAASVAGSLSSPLGGLTPDALFGPVVVPGTYTVELTADGQSQSQTFEVVADSRISASQEDLQVQHDLLIEIRDQVSKVHQSVERLRTLRDQVGSWAARVDDDGVKQQASEIRETLDTIELELIQPQAGDPRVFPSGVNEKLASLTGMIANADSRPAAQYFEVFAKLREESDAQVAALQSVVDNQIAAFNKAVLAAGVQPVG